MSNISPTFCAYCVSHINIGPSGSGSVCCRPSGELINSHGREMSIHIDTFQEMWNSDYMREVRRRMVAGEAVGACRSCYQTERAGGLSLRMHANKTVQSFASAQNVEEAFTEARRIVETEGGKAPPPSSLHLWLGNLCNLKCRMCSASYSSQIAADPVHSRWSGGLGRKVALLPDYLPTVKYEGFDEIISRGKSTYRVLKSNIAARIIAPATGDPISLLQIRGQNASEATGMLVVTINAAREFRREAPAGAWAFDINLGEYNPTLQTIDIALRVEGVQAPIWIEGLTLYTAPAPGKAQPREIVSRLAENPAWYDNEDVMFDELFGAPEHLRHLSFAGGEPLLHKRLEDVLQMLVDRGLAKNISLFFSTNGTQKSPRFSELLRQFRHVSMAVSLDGVGKMQEYIRPPTHWDSLQRNLISYRDLFRSAKNWTLQVHPTPQAYNVFGLIDLVRFCDENGIEIILENALLQPRHLSLDMLPQSIIDEAIERWCAYKDEVSDKLARQVEALLTVLRRPRPTDLAALQTTFSQFTKALDESRSQSLTDVDPELYRRLAQENVLH